MSKDRPDKLTPAEVNELVMLTWASFTRSSKQDRRKAKQEYIRAEELVRMKKGD